MLDPAYSVVPAPVGHANVSTESPFATGLLVRPKTIDSNGGVDLFEHLQDIPVSHDKRSAQCAKLIYQLEKAFPIEAVLPCRHVWLKPPLRLDYDQRKYGASFSCFAQRPMISNTEILLEPNHLYSRVVHGDWSFREKN